MTTQPAYVPPPHGFRTFLIVWATQSVSVLGSGLTYFATTIWLTTTLYPLPEQKPELAWALSGVSLAFALPVVFGAPIAGAWADRHDRKRTMIMMDVCSGLLSIVLVALLATGALTLWLLLLIVLVHATISSFHQSAFDTSYAMIVPEHQLPRANGMMQTIWSLSGIIAPGIAAALISLPALAQQGHLPILIAAPLAALRDGTPLAVAVDGVTFFLAALALVPLFIPSPKRTDLADSGPKKSMWADIKIGARYIGDRPTLLWLLGTFTVANLVGSPLGVFEPLIVKFNLAGDWTARGFTLQTALALLGTVGGIGGLAGGLLISVWGGLKHKRVYGVVVAMIAQGVAQITFGLSTSLYLTAAMAFVVSAMIPIMNSHSQAIWQTQTPRELQGRVFSVRRLIAQFTWPFSTALAGWAGGLFNPGMVMAVLGGILMLFCVAQLFNPYLLRVEDKAWLDEMAARKATPSSVGD